jgi:transposase-like protein
MLNIQDLKDDAKCYAVVQDMRWPEGAKCPQCGSGEIKKRGFHSQQAQQRYECQACERQFDDLTGIIQILLS